MKKISLTILTAATLIFAATGLFGYTKNAAAEASNFNPANVRPNATTTYSVTLKNVSGQIAAADIPFPSGLQIIGQSRSASFSMGTGGSSQETKITFTILAKKEGTYNIPPWKLKLDGQEFSMPAAVLKVSEDAPEAPVQVSSATDPFAQMRSRRTSQQGAQRQSFSDNLRDKIALDLKLPKEKIYVGESVPCTLVFSCDKSLAESGFQLQQLIPQAKKADDFECAPFSGKPNIDTTNPDKIFVTFQTVVTPLKAGTYTLDFFAQGVFVRELNVDDMMGMSIFDRMSTFGMGRQIPFEVNMPDKKLEILPLPSEGKPSDFSGAIGKFELQKTSVEPDALTVGDPCIITANIIGSGNFLRMGNPVLQNTDGWKSYKPKSSFKDDSAGMNFVGTKTFTFTAVPSKPDLPFAPTLAFSYFDADKAEYVTLQSVKIPVSVAPSGRSKRIESEDVKKAEPAFGTIVEKRDSAKVVELSKSPWFWIAQLAAIAAVVAFVVARKRKLRFENDPAFAKFAQCTKRASAAISAARRCAKKSDPEGFFKNATEFLRESVAARSELDPSAVLCKEAETFFVSKNASAEETDSIREIFAGADAIAFGGLEVRKADIQKCSANLEKIASLLK